ncbi:MAG: hypothetical protein JWN95_2262 [Frankiales bacterium]|nr:hypothetical protein [Frankiales bacterium]
MSVLSSLMLVAIVTYLVNCALGLGVTFRLVDTSAIHWIHHALFFVVAASAAAAAIAAIVTGHRTGWWLAVVFIPYAVLPFVRAPSARHVQLALSAAPFYLISALFIWRT